MNKPLTYAEILQREFGIFLTKLLPHCNQVAGTFGFTIETDDNKYYDVVFAYGSSTNFKYISSGCKYVANIQLTEI